MGKYLVILGAIVSFTGVLLYIREVFRGKAKPNKVSWLLWSVAPMIATVAALSQGVRRSVLPVFMSGFAPFLVFLVSLFVKQSYRKLSYFDYICGALSLLALLLWGITKNPNIAIIFAILSDFAAATPTLKKSWQHPDSESPIGFIGGLFNATTAFFVLQSFSFAELAFPIYLVVIDITLISFIILGRKSKKQK
ncbi:MAG TPA: hypothetical protein PK674_03225 [Candidatus Absconditabacterales bacterium]|nr:hypothetical protein [Candidatus Absconditabacterales bacterium]HOQ78642.1 hypothetical protein [Candidatus Absconditabacterales bacterium]HPK28060.1 hypothetical protein [Candidatus Absconditabacterales bacterium]